MIDATPFLFMNCSNILLLIVAQKLLSQRENIDAELSLYQCGRFNQIIW